MKKRNRQFKLMDMIWFVAPTSDQNDDNDELALHVHLPNDAVEYEFTQKEATEFRDNFNKLLRFLTKGNLGA